MWRYLFTYHHLILSLSLYLKGAIPFLTLGLFCLYAMAIFSASQNDATFFLCSRLVLLWMISSAFSTENIKRWLKTQYWELIALKLLIVGNFYILLAFQKSRYEITQLEKPQIEEFGDICVIFLPCAEVLSTTSIMEGWRKHSSVVRNFVFLLS